MRTIMAQYRLAYHILSELGRQGYTTVNMFSVFYTDEADLAATAPRELTFRHTDPGFDEESSKRGRIRLPLASTHAKNPRSHRQRIISSNTTEGDVRLPGQGSIRGGAEEVWNTRHGAKPPLEDQGTDTFLGRIYKDMGTGNVGVYQQKQRVGRLDNHTKTTTETPTGSSRRRRPRRPTHPPPSPSSSTRPRSWPTPSGWCPTPAPPSRRSRSPSRTWTTATPGSSDPTSPAAPPPPPLKVLETAGLAAWRRIAIELHRGGTSKEAMKDTKADALSWQREVYGKPNYQAPGATSAQALQAAPTLQRQGYFYNSETQGDGAYAPSGKKGKGGKGAKGKTTKGLKGEGKGKAGGKNDDRAAVSDVVWGNWADRGPPTSWHPDGQKTCRHFNTSNRWGGCGMSHSHCPRMLASGRHCLQDQKAYACTAA